MRILVFSTAYYPFVGGAEVAIKEISDRNKEHDWVLITARMRKDLPKYEKVGEVHVWRVGLGRSIDTFLLPLFGTFRALSLHAQKKIDFSWSMMASQASIAAGFFTWLRPSVPLVLTLQEGDEEEHLMRYAGGNEFLYRMLVQPWHRLVFTKANRVTAISSALRERAYRNGVKSKVEIIPNGVDFSKFIPPTFREKNSSPILITTSRLVEKNGTSDVIRALPLMPAVRFWIIGTGEQELELKALAHSLGVADRITFFGFLSHEEIVKKLGQADIFIRPSLSEGLGNSFLEAMAMKLPIIATQVGGIQDFLVDGETGVACLPGNPASIARAVVSLLENPSRAEEIALAGYKLVHERYDWVQIARQMNDFFGKRVSKESIFLIATGIYPPDIGGPATYAKGLYGALSLHNPRTHVFTYGIEKKMPTGVRHFVTFLKFMVAMPFVDAVIALDTFSVGFPAVLAAVILRKKVIVRIGGDFLWEQYINRTQEEVLLSEFYQKSRALTFKEKLIFWCTGFVLRNATGIVFSTDWQKNIMVGAYGVSPEKKIICIENNIGEKLPTHEPVRKNFLWAGRPIFLKNIDRLREAFEKARKVHPDLELDILEATPHGELLNRISQAYAVVLPSLSEVSPNLILEAIQCGKPFVMTRESGYTDRFKEFGLFFDPRSSDDIAQKIVELADDGEYKKRILAIHSFNGVHTYKQIADEFISFYKSL
jgi:glycosyltransferase involved in cell wall biosynthesis